MDISHSPILFWQVDHAGPEGHLDLDEGLVAVGQEIFGLARVDPDHAKQQVSRSSEGHFDLGKRGYL